MDTENIKVSIQTGKASLWEERIVMSLHSMEEGALLFEKAWHFNRYKLMAKNFIPFISVFVLLIALLIAVSFILGKWFPLIPNITSKDYFWVFFGMTVGSVLSSVWSKRRNKEYSLQLVPSEIKEEVILLAAFASAFLVAVKIDGSVLESVPEELKTEELCLAAVKINSNALEHVPEELRTADIRLAAAERNGRAPCEHMPANLKTLELYRMSACNLKASLPLVVFVVLKLTGVIDWSWIW